MTKRFGFTLAEVLITLTIIGVVAAMTIPTLLSNSSDQQYKTGLKKAISAINQAITMQYALEGTDMTDYYSETANYFTTSGVAKEVFQARMQVVITTSERSTTYGYNKSAGNQAVYLSDGMVIEFPKNFAQNNQSVQCKNDFYSSTNNADGCLYTIIVDVNGNKGKCIFGTGDSSSTKLTVKDCFPLDVHPDGVKPADYVGRAIMYEGK